MVLKLFSDGEILLLLILFIITVILGIIGMVLIKVKTSGMQIKLAESAVDKKKLEYMMKRALIEDLKSASVMLSDSERTKLEKIKVDQAVLSRKVLFLMNELEERTKRLELGSDYGKLNLSIGKVNKYERKLFGK